MSAGSLMVCLLRFLRWNRESSCCCCPSVSGQVELMHYLKSLLLTLCVSLLPLTQSHKRPKVTGTMKTRRSSIPLPTPVTPQKHTHTQASKHTQLPLTYHHCLHTLHTCKAANTQTYTPLCSALSLLWIPSHVSCSSPVTPPPSTISLSLPDLIMAPPG